MDVSPPTPNRRGKLRRFVMYEGGRRVFAGVYCCHSPQTRGEAVPARAMGDFRAAPVLLGRLSPREASRRARSTDGDALRGARRLG